MFWFGERHISANVLVWRALQPGLASMLAQRRLWPGYSARPTNIASSDMRKVHTDTGLTMPANSATPRPDQRTKKEPNKRNIFMF
jgi:hypothetical protein